eukprot:1333180-Prymnesium_polylepis.1
MVQSKLCWLSDLQLLQKNACGCGSTRARSAASRHAAQPPLDGSTWPPRTLTSSRPHCPAQRSSRGTARNCSSNGGPRFQHVLCPYSSTPPSPRGGFCKGGYVPAERLCDCQ